MFLVLWGCNQASVKKESNFDTREYFEAELKKVNFDDGITMDEAQIIFENYTLACHGLISALTPVKIDNYWLAPVCFNGTVPICRGENPIKLDTVERTISFEGYEKISDIYNVWNICKKKSS